MGWLFGKRSAETHGFWLARISNKFLGAVLGRDGLSRKSGLRCTALSVGVINEMMMNGPVDQSKWSSVRPALENHLVRSLEANLEAIGHPAEERSKLAADLREQANDACRHVLALAQQAERLQGKGDPEQFMSSFMRQQMIYISPDHSPAQRENILPAFTAAYVQLLHQPAASYLKRHFVQGR